MLVDLLYFAVRLVFGHDGVDEKSQFELVFEGELVGDVVEGLLYTFLADEGGILAELQKLYPGLDGLLLLLELVSQNGGLLECDFSFEFDKFLNNSRGEEIAAVDFEVLEKGDEGSEFLHK